MITLISAFRFFAPNAQPLNRIVLEDSTRHSVEQPGGIHANMDLYRWAYASMPWIGSDLLWECFELSVELRVLDMQAGPYDLRALGFEPVPVRRPKGETSISGVAGDEGASESVVVAVDRFQERQSRERSRVAVALRATIDTLHEWLLQTDRGASLVRPGLSQERGSPRPRYRIR